MTDCLTLYSKQACYLWNSILTRHRQFAISVWAAVVLSGALGVGWAFAEFQPVLHEHFEPDAKEDLELGVRVTAGGLPAAIQAPAGAVPVPNPTRPIDRSEPTYSERQASDPGRFRIDRETTDPGRLTYHEPFRPSVAPFKRTHVFDAVNADFELTLSDAKPKPVTIGGVPGPDIDQFYGEVVLEIDSEQRIRIPSAGPHMAVYAAHLEPEMPFGFYVDGAENWFLRAPEGRGKARLVMHVGVVRDAFDGRVEAISYSALSAKMPQVPANVERGASEVLQQLGISPVLAPADAISRLVTYFRGFAESTDRPSATEGEMLYRELVLSRKGVCRHRAYAFVVTALGLRIPARFVHNEAHAWVEVFGGKYWHRIDLGGAASGIDYRGEPPQGPKHRPPSEAYRWPPQGKSATSSGPAEQSLSQTPTEGTSVPAVTTATNPWQPSPANSSTGSASSGERGPSSDLEQALGVTSGEETPRVAPGHSRITAALSTAAEIQRGQSLGVRGRIAADRGQCGGVRLDFVLVGRSHRFPVSTARADSDGQFAVTLAVPGDIPVGKYDLEVSSPGSKDCPASSKM